MKIVKISLLIIIILYIGLILVQRLTNKTIPGVVNVKKEINFTVQKEEIDANLKPEKDGARDVYFLAYKKAVEKCGEDVKFLKYAKSNIENRGSDYQFSGGSCAKSFENDYNILEIPYSDDGILGEPIIRHYSGYSPQPIEVLAWIISSQHAADIVLATKKPGTQYTVLNLRKEKNKPLAWHVFAGDIYQVNAITGVIIDKRAMPMTIDSGY